MLESLVKEIESYRDTFQDEKDIASNFLQFLSEYRELSFSRDLILGHLTASAFLLSPDQSSVLLTHHQKLNLWVQLGGHIDSGEIPVEAALREAREESGIEKILILRKSIFDLDVHRIPSRASEPEHFHFDIRYLLQAQSWEFKISEESKDLAWIKLIDPFWNDLEASLQRMRNKILQVEKLIVSTGLQSFQNLNF